MKRADLPVEPPIGQKYLGRKGLVVFLALLSAFIPLSTDLYLAALPTMTLYFGVPEYQTNLTLIFFFVFYSVALLVWGPLSDRFGRRPVLLGGLSLYLVAGCMCALSVNIFQLMFFRVLQAVGASSASAVSTAIVKDAYVGRRREAVLALVQSMVVISPVVAPVVGALLLRFVSWRGTFLAMAALGVLAVGLAIAFQETLLTKHSGTVFASFRRLGVVLKNRAFLYMLLLFAPLSIPAMAFIAASSFIYQETFRVSGETYSLFFAIYAINLAVGPQIYMVLSRWIGRSAIMTGCIAATAASGLLVVLLGQRGPWYFILCLIPTSIAMSCLRPPMAYLMLDQHDGDGGSVSALMGSSHMVMGSVGMIIVSMQLADRVLIIGLLNLVVGLLITASWLTVVQPLVEASRRE